MDDNGNVIDFQRSKVSIRELLGGAQGKLPPPPAAREPGPAEALGTGPEASGLDMALPERLDPLPRSGDPYQAHARVANKPMLTVRFLLRDGTVRGFSTATFDSLDRLPGGKPGGAPVIVVRFAGLTPTEITLEGRNLDGLYDHLGEHRIPWVRERGAGRDFLGEADAVITDIRITPLS